MNWVLQLNNSQLGNSFTSLLEKHHVLNSPNQPNPNPNQSVNRLGKPEDTERVSCERSGKPEKLSEDISVKHAHDGSGNLMKSSASTHTVKEQLALQDRSGHCII